jgi:hypothetical protein
MTVSHDEEAGSSSAPLMNLPEGLGNIGMGFGPGGKPLPEIANLMIKQQVLFKCNIVFKLRDLNLIN